MRKLKEMSIEELLDLEEKLRASRDEGKAGSMNKAINVYEELHRKIKSNTESEYKQSIGNIEKQLVRYLIRYGTYLKSEYEKEGRLAKRTLEKALRYDRTNPLAHYRLGFIAYKEEDYVKSMLRFKEALQSEERNDYKLSPQQLYNAGLYLSNSALYIAKQAQASLEKVEGIVNKTAISNLELSPLYEIITQNEAYLLNHAFSMTSQDGVRRCSKNECEKLVESDCSGTMILYFSDRGQSVYYRGQEVGLSIDQAEMLKQFMLGSSEERPTIKDDFRRFIKDNTYITAVTRLRRKLEQFQISTPIIINKQYQNETGYYYDQTLLYLVIERDDDAE